MRRASALGAVLALAAAGCGGSSTSTSRVTTASRASTGTAPANPPPSTVTTTTNAKPPAPTKGTTTARSLNPASPAKTVNLALTATDPAVCALYSPQLVAKSFGGQQGCRSSVASGGRASSVKIVKTQPEGRYALLVAVPHGGPSSGEKLTISLVRTNGRWQLQSIKSNTPVGP